MRSLVREYYYLGILAKRLRDDIECIDEAVLAQGSCPDCPVLGPNRDQKVINRRFNLQKCGAAASVHIAAYSSLVGTHAVKPGFPTVVNT